MFGPRPFIALWCVLTVAFEYRDHLIGNSGASATKYGKDSGFPAETTQQLLKRQDEEMLGVAAWQTQTVLVPPLSLPPPLPHAHPSPLPYTCGGLCACVDGTCACVQSKIRF